MGRGTEPPDERSAHGEPPHARDRGGVGPGPEAGLPRRPLLRPRRRRGSGEHGPRRRPVAQGPRAHRAPGADRRPRRHTASARASHDQSRPPRDVSRLGPEALLRTDRALPPGAGARARPPGGPGPPLPVGRARAAGPVGRSDHGPAPQVGAHGADPLRRNRPPGGPPGCARGPELGRARSPARGEGTPHPGPGAGVRGNRWRGDREGVQRGARTLPPEPRTTIRSEVWRTARRRRASVPARGCAIG